MNDGQGLAVAKIVETYRRDPDEANAVCSSSRGTIWKIEASTSSGL